jgi:hypothetical protein
MAQGDMNIANQGFPAFRADLNDQLEALVTNSSGATAPATIFPHQWWLDTSTTPSTLRQRNAANDAWIVVGLFNQSTNTFNVPVEQGGTGAADAGGARTNLGALASTDPSYTGTLTGGTGVINIGSGQLYKDASGNVGIGTSSPGSKLDVVGTTPVLRVVGSSASNPSIRLSSEGVTAWNMVASGSDSSLSWNRDGSERMRIDGNGVINVFSSTQGFNSRISTAAGGNQEIFLGRHSATSTTTGTLCFFVFSNGNVSNTNNSYGAISDIKLKENIVDANSQWDDIKALQIRNYNFKKETGQQTHTQIGLIAQETELVSPGLVTESPDRDEEGNDLGTVTKSVNYSILYIKAVKALQEAMERIEALEASNQELKVRLDAANL